MKPVSAENKIAISRRGLKVTSNLTFEEWQSMASRFGAAMSSAAFVIGDWLVYGEDHFRGQGRLAGFEGGSTGRKVSLEAYETAVQLTGLDRTTLATYAYVARHVPHSLRNEQLSWEHHKAVAKLEPQDQEHWLKLAQGESDGATSPVSTRRLRKSITVGRLLSPDEITAEAADRGQPNHIPFLNRLWSWWTQMKESGWPKRATPEQKETLKRDLSIVLRIMQELD